MKGQTTKAMKMTGSRTKVRLLRSRERPEIHTTGLGLYFSLANE